jgi:hypothetical protein
VAWRSHVRQVGHFAERKGQSEHDQTRDRNRLFLLKRPNFPARPDGGQECLGVEITFHLSNRAHVWANYEILSGDGMFITLRLFSESWSRDAFGP